MSLVVQKFGGTSVASIERILSVAQRVQREVEAGHRVVTVVSAMAGVTNQLVAWVREITPFYDAAEYDVVVSSGEIVTSGLLAVALQRLGIPARSWQAWQIPIQAEGAHTKGRITSIVAQELQKDVEQGRVAVISGFQAISPDRRMITLGRGGSDTSAVFLAAALQAERCDIYTDVDGIYSADPRVVSRSQKLNRLSYTEVLEFASLGAKVLHVNSVLAAWRYRVKLRVLSSFEDLPGTLVVTEEEMESEVTVRGVSISLDEVMCTVEGEVTDLEILRDLATLNTSCDLVMSTKTGEQKSLSFLLPKPEKERVEYILGRKENVRAFHMNDQIAKVSVIGLGLRCQPHIMLQILEVVARVTSEVLSFMATEVRVSIVVPRDYAELLARALHTTFGLDRED